MSPIPSNRTPEEGDQYTAPPTPENECEDPQAYPPMHPLPSMQAAFEESMYEQGHTPPEPTNPYAVAVTVPTSSSSGEEFKPIYHPLTKLVSQITFGMHLLHKRLAKSDSEVVRILQAHVNDMDHFLSTTTQDFDAARADISGRIKNLKVPLEAGPASDVFENMLKEPGFRTQIMEGNKKVDSVIKKTVRAMNGSLEDVGEGLKAVDELAKYLLTLKTGWRNANLLRVYGAMTHNVEGWFRCFVGLKMKGQVLGERLNSLKMVVWEIERRCGRASRNGRISMAVIKKRPSLNQIPENPTEANDVGISLKKTAKASPLAQVEEKPLPYTPIPTPVPVVGNLISKDRRHSSPDLVDSPPLTPRKTLSKRRTSVAGSPAVSTIKTQKAGERMVEPAIKLDHEIGTLRRKRFHRRSATIHVTQLRKEQEEHPLNTSVTVITACAGELDTTAGPSGTESSVLSSLRRSLSLGRSSGRPRSRSRDKSAPEHSECDDLTREEAPPVPQLPARVHQKIEQMRKEGSPIPAMVSTAEVTPPASRGSKAAASERASERSPSRVTGAVMAGIASIKKRKSKPQLHPTSPRSYPPTNLHDQNGQRKVLHTSHLASPVGVVTENREQSPSQRRVKRTNITSPSSVPGSTRPSEVKKQPKPNVNSLHVKPPKTVAVATATVELASPSLNPPTPTSPPAKARKNSSAISNLLSLRPKSRTGVHMSGQSTGTPVEPVPPLPVSNLSKPSPQIEERLAIKEENVGNSAILASVRELQEKKAQAVPAFKLQGGTAPPAKHAKDASRRLSLLGTGSNSKGLPAPVKKAPEGPVSPAKGKNSGSFLVRFFTDRAF